MVMVDDDESHTIGKQKLGSIRDLWKAYRSIVRKWYVTKISSPNKCDHERSKVEAIDKTHQDVREKREGEETMRASIGSRKYTAESEPSSPKGFFKKIKSIPSSVSRSASRSSSRSSTPLRSMSRKNYNPAGLSRSVSASAHPIMFSNSTGMVKPPAIERKLECTLEELCFGCTKNIKITRDNLTDSGQVVQDEEMLKIKIKPGWKKGTKITFEGMGNERPGSYPADIIFVIAEKRHHMFKREGDDLELAVKITLLKALTGFTVPIPLLGGNNMNLVINDVIYPGYEKIIPGQGMPSSKEDGKRGNLKIVFLVEFPTELTDGQRSDIFSILEDSSSS